MKELLNHNRTRWCLYKFKSKSNIMSNAVDAWLEKDSFSSNITRGLISGVLGGLAGTLVKPELNIVEGAIYGATTWVGTHETSLPLLGLKDKPKDIPMNIQANELIAHLAFGITTEVVRALISKKLRE